VIKQIGERELLGEFAPLLGEVECGRHFDPRNPEHVKWLQWRVKAFIARGARFYGLHSDDGAPIGLVSLLPDQNLPGLPWHGDHGDIMHLGVAAGERRSGHGRRLVEHVEGVARELGHRSLMVSTTEGSEAASFYEACGYERVTVIPGIHGPSERGLVLFRKPLRPADSSP